MSGHGLVGRDNAVEVVPCVKRIEMFESKCIYTCMQIKCSLTVDVLLIMLPQVIVHLQKSVCMCEGTNIMV